MKETKVLFLDQAEVARLLNYPDVVASVEKVFLSDGNGMLFVPESEHIHIGERNLLFPMASCLYDLGIAGVKWTNFYPQSPVGLPPCWGHILILSHIEDGLPYAILDATSITAYRTAGGHAVAAARRLAKPDSRVLSILGCGTQGLSAIRSFVQFFPLEEIRILTGQHSLERVRPLLQKELSIPVDFVSTPQELMDGADILVTASTSQSPVILAEHIPAGCFVAAMYAFNDLDSHFAAAADKWVIGQHSSDRREILHLPKFSGLLDEQDIYASLGEIMTGKKPGRTSARERILFTHMGMGALDIAIADDLVHKARQSGRGLELLLNRQDTP